MKNRLPRTSSSWNIKLQPIARLCGHASASNYFMIFVPLDYMYCEAGSPSDNDWCIESILWIPIIRISIVDNWHSQLYALMAIAGVLF